MKGEIQSPFIYFYHAGKTYISLIHIVNTSLKCNVTLGLSEFVIVGYSLFFYY